MKIVTIFFIFILSVNVIASQNYSFEDTIGIIYLPPSGGSHLFAVRGESDVGRGALTVLLDHFLPYVNIMSPYTEQYPQHIDEFKFFSLDGEISLYLGQNWIGDGVNLVEITKHDFDFIQKYKTSQKLNDHPRGIEARFMRKIREVVEDLDIGVDAGEEKSSSEVGQGESGVDDLNFESNTITKTERNHNVENRNITSEVEQEPQSNGDLEKLDIEKYSKELGSSGTSQAGNIITYAEVEVISEEPKRKSRYWYLLGVLLLGYLAWRNLLSKT